MSWIGNNYDIFRIDLEGKVETVIQSDSMHEGWHSWSPDGQWLTYSGAALDSGDYNIYLSSKESKRTKQLTSSVRAEQAPVFVSMEVSAAL